MLPNTDLATTKQVYGVPISTVYSLIHDNREELEINGMKNMSYKDLKEVVFNPSLKNGLENHPTIKLSRRGSTVFAPRAILNVGMLLRDSKIAEEVRNQVLNIVESATDEHKTTKITKEKELLMAIMFAGNEIERATAINVHVDYMNRHKKQLEETIDKQTKVISHKSDVIEGLTDSISLADKRQILNKVIRKGCSNNISITNRWSFLYEQFEMKHHINVRVRKNNYIQNTGIK